MGHHQPHKADAAADRHRRGGEQRRVRNQNFSHQVDVHPQGDGGAVAHHHGVQGHCQQIQQHRREHQHNQGKQHVAALCAAEAAQHPEGSLAHRRLLGGGIHQIVGCRPQDGGNRHTHQHQPDGCHLPGGFCQGVHQHNGEDGPGKRAGWNAEHSAGGQGYAHQHSKHRAGGSAAGNA